MMCRRMATNASWPAATGSHAAMAISRPATRNSRSRFAAVPELSVRGTGTCSHDGIRASWYPSLAPPLPRHRAHRAPRPDVVLATWRT